MIASGERGRRLESVVMLLGGVTVKEATVMIRPRGQQAIGGGRERRRMNGGGPGGGIPRSPMKGVVLMSRSLRPPATQLFPFGRLDSFSMKFRCFSCCR